MTPVSQFAQYLLKHDPQRNPGRLTLYNFMKHVADPQAPFTPAVIQEFYARVLQFEHWQAEAVSLSETVRADIDGFLNQHAQAGDLDPWLHLRHADSLQVVSLRHFQDLADLVEAEHAAGRKSGSDVRTIRLSDTQILVLLLSPGGSLEAKVYPSQALVWGPRLRLVAPTTRLLYGTDFELLPNVRQTLEGSLLTVHCFHVDNEGVHGLTTRGHTFQKFETFIRARLPETQDLFYTLKKLERHYINPQSDPYYQEMVTRLERANRLLGGFSQDGLAEAERALGRGRLALKNIFPNDRLLTLLVTHLEYGISQRRAGGGKPAQTQ